MNGKRGHKGFFVTFEGIDGAGKTTLLDHIYEHLLHEGRPVRKTREPGGTRVGQICRKTLLQSDLSIDPQVELHLFLADRVDHVKRVILPSLERGDILLCDRFNDSTIAYQHRAYEHRVLKMLCALTTSHLMPDLTFLLDLDPSVGLVRKMGASAAPDRIEQEAIPFFQKVREIYLSLAAEEPNRIRILDADLPPHALCESALQIINRSM